jgi:hypothetical protein
MAYLGDYEMKPSTNATIWKFRIQPLALTLLKYCRVLAC